MTKKLDLIIEDLEDRIAPALILPNGDIIFGGMLLPNSATTHPAVADGMSSPGFPGPWNATEPFGGPLGFQP